MGMVSGRHLPSLERRGRVQKGEKEGRTPPCHVLTSVLVNNNNTRIRFTSISYTYIIHMLVVWRDGDEVVKSDVLTDM